MLQHEFLRLGKLRDHAQPRSTLPLSRATPAGFSRRSGSRDDQALDRTHRLPLGWRRWPKKRENHQNQTQQPRKVPTRIHLSLLLAEAAPRFRVLIDSTAGSSAIRPPTSDAVRLADGLANMIQLRSIKDPMFNSNQRKKKSEAHLSQYAPKTHLQAEEAYSDSYSKS